MHKYEIYVLGGKQPIITFADDINKALIKVQEAFKNNLDVDKVLICHNGRLNDKALERLEV